MKFEHAQKDYQSYNIPLANHHHNNEKNELGNREIESKLFYDNKMRGVFFSYSYNGILRVYITLENDTSLYNDEIASLLRSSINKCNAPSGLLWVRKKTPKVIAFLENEFLITPSDELFFYESTTFVMPIAKFQKEYASGMLEIKQYEDSFLDDCLKLFNEAMLFKMPPHFYLDEREHYFEQLRFNAENVVFETFWKDDELIGLYWLCDEEIDVIAVSAKHQRKGYGSLILTRAIEKAFQTSNKEYVWLIASNFNEKAHSFYCKYGMEAQKQNRLSRIDSPIKLDMQMRLASGN
ncbi:MAG: GNAT family N-acetyltransferase [Defluviitaleaceae bacterium]|nr:GNAT family N-acetyltransferase [Defluviitaleaceae bacterium]